MPVPEDELVGDATVAIKDNFENQNNCNSAMSSQVNNYLEEFPTTMDIPHYSAENMFVVHVSPGATFSVRRPDGTYQVFTGQTVVPLYTSDGFAPRISLPAYFMQQVFQQDGVKHVMIVPSNTVEGPNSFVTNPALHQPQSPIPIHNLPQHAGYYQSNIIPNNQSEVGSYFIHHPVPVKEDPRSSGDLSVSSLSPMHLSSHSSTSSSDIQSSSSGLSYLQDPAEWNRGSYDHMSGEQSIPIDYLPETSSSMRSSSSPASGSSLTSSPRNSPKLGHYSLKSNGVKTSRSPSRFSPRVHRGQKVSSSPSQMQLLTAPASGGHARGTGQPHTTTDYPLPVTDNTEVCKDDPDKFPLDGASSPESRQSDTIEEILGTVLGTVQTPVVNNVTTRGASVVWCELSLEQASNEVKEVIEKQSILYNLHLAKILPKKSNPGKFESKYKGPSLSCELNDLKPGFDYSVRLCAICDDITGPLSEATPFRTLSTVPDVPIPPKLLQSYKNALTLALTPPCDNGDRIQRYYWEYDEAENRTGFKIVQQNLSKQCKVTKLTPSRGYVFRLAAENKLGRSDWSREVTHHTTGVAPSTPNPPVLVRSSARSLSVAWTVLDETEQVDSYTLQMDDVASRFGFRVCYNGSDTEYTVNNLSRSSTYKFRVLATNSTGSSNYSKATALRTSAEQPQIPGKPQLKGNKHSRSLSLHWAAARDDGGAEITEYRVEMSEVDQEAMTSVYVGRERECTVNGLEPGHSYRFRVLCSNGNASSLPSDEAVFTTKPVAPGQCPTPMLAVRPKSFCITIKWESPSNTGGASIEKYEVNYSPASSPSDLQLAYSGPSLECTVFNLCCGTMYTFAVRAANQIDFGAWSDRLEVMTSAGCPEKPEIPQVSLQTSTCIALQWKPPADNGAEITHYIVNWGAAEEAMNSYTTKGPRPSFDFETLRPNTTYYFGIMAVNSEGNSPPSDVGSARTLPGCPDRVSNLRLGISNAEDAETDDKPPVSSYHVSIVWDAARDGGSDITGYQVALNVVDSSLAERLYNVVGDETNMDIDDLQPDTEHKISVCATNAIGVGEPSSTLVVRTKPLPPEAPVLICSQRSFNSLKLEWTARSKVSVGTQYSLQVRDKNGRFATLYRGSNTSYRSTRLTEETSYRFRIHALNSEGSSPYHEALFETEIQPPSAVDVPTVRDVEATECKVSWSKIAKLKGDAITYKVRLEPLNRSDEISVFECDSTSYVLSSLTPHTGYRLRVSAVRLHPSDHSTHEVFKEASGPPSPYVTIQTSKGVKTEDPGPPKLLALFPKSSNIEAPPAVSTSASGPERVPVLSTSPKGSGHPSTRWLSDDSSASLRSIAYHLLCAIIAACVLNYFYV